MKHLLTLDEASLDQFMGQGLHTDLRAAALSLPTSPLGNSTLLHLLHNNIKPPIDLPSLVADRIMWQNKVLFVEPNEANVAFEHCNHSFVKSQGFYIFKTQKV